MSVLRGFLLLTLNYLPNVSSFQSKFHNFTHQGLGFVGGKGHKQGYIYTYSPTPDRGYPHPEIPQKQSYEMEWHASCIGLENPGFR